MGRLRGTWAIVALASFGLAVHSAAAGPRTPLSAHDATLYAAAFDAAQRGDAAAADQALAQVTDPCLAGKVQYLELTRAKARTASYEELASWLKLNADMPGASEVYELALKRKPADAELPAPADTAAGAPDGDLRIAKAPESHAAREAFYSGDVQRALTIARESGDAWIAGLAAWRLGQYAEAMVSFETLAANPSEDDATRAAGGVWAARAASAAGMADRATPLLKIAAAEADTFYGMIAERKLELASDPLGQALDAALSAAPTVTTEIKDESPIDRLVRTDPRAHRAVALMQLSRSLDASAELRAGFAAAGDDQTRALWMSLMFELNGQPAAGEIVLHGGPHAAAHTTYPVPQLAPEGGFTIDPALVYAVTWQESRFNSIAVSPVGAIGLMQLMPPSAAYVSGDTRLKTDPIVLFDTGRNLALGQTYIQWLEANAAGYDILRTIAAYNGGPGTLARAEAAVGPDADSLTLIESLPFAETRAYVKKVMAAYWTYRRQFGAPTHTLDAVASDQPRIDVRLDASTPIQSPQPAPAEARQALEILLHRPG